MWEKYTQVQTLHRMEDFNRTIERGWGHTVQAESPPIIRRALAMAYRSLTP